MSLPHRALLAWTATILCCGCAKPPEPAEPAPVAAEAATSVDPTLVRELLRAAKPCIDGYPGHRPQQLKSTVLLNRNGPHVALKFLEAVDARFSACVAGNVRRQGIAADGLALPLQIRVAFDFPAQATATSL